MRRDSANQSPHPQGDLSSRRSPEFTGSPESSKLPEPSGRTEMWRQFAEYSGLAIAMPIATVLGYAFGRWLDATLSTSFLWLVGLLLGIASGFTQLVRKAMKDSSFGAK